MCYKQSVKEFAVFRLEIKTELGHAMERGQTTVTEHRMWTKIFGHSDFKKREKLFLKNKLIHDLTTRVHTVPQ